MSYYNVTLTCIVLATVSLYEQICEKEFKKKKLYVLGIFLAFAGINTPYLAVPYMAIMGYLLIRKRYRPYWREILAVIVGVATVGAVYIGYVLYNTSINEILLNIPYILSEPELQRTNPFLVIPIILARIVWRYKWTIWISIFLMIYIYYKKRKGSFFSKEELNWLIGIDFSIFLLNSFLSKDLLGCINIAGVLFALPLICIFMDWKSLDKRIVGMFGGAGASLVLAFSFSSDTGLDAMAIGFVLIGMGTVLLFFRLDELKKKQAMIVVTALVF
ncbi:MAG: hypothetical protein PUC12_13025, partial [Clostridiales bacterium]|nr:hypothetical protein [Clostridiales bacterium]